MRIAIVHGVGQTQGASIVQQMVDEMQQAVIRSARDLHMHLTHRVRRQGEPSEASAGLLETVQHWQMVEGTLKNGQLSDGTIDDTPWRHSQ